MNGKGDRYRPCDRAKFAAGWDLAFGKKGGKVLTTIDGHSFDESLLAPGGWVLDAGCRGFAFARWMAEREMNVLALDPDPAAVILHTPLSHRILLCEVALDVKVGHRKYASWSTGEGNYLTDTPPDYASVSTVGCVTIADLMVRYNIPQFDLIKLDIEGSEYEILRNLPPRCTKQLSVEFHDFLGRNPYEPDRERFYRELFAGPLTDYEVVQHERTPGGCKQMNYWDTCLKLRGVE